jgi:hypothetical protein
VCSSCTPEQKNKTPFFNEGEDTETPFFNEGEDTETPFFNEGENQKLIYEKTPVGRTRCGGYYKKNGQIESKMVTLEEANALLDEAKESSKKILTEKKGGLIYEDSNGNLFKITIGEGASFSCGELRGTPQPSPTPTEEPYF